MSGGAGDEPPLTPGGRSGTSTPNYSYTTASSTSWTVSSSFTGAVSGLLRRFSTEPPRQVQTHSSLPSPGVVGGGHAQQHASVYTPPHRTASPFRPPPLYPIVLRGSVQSASPGTGWEHLLTRALAEEIRLLIPARLQLCEEWRIVYSLAHDGVSLGTLYKKCEDLRGVRCGFVLIVKDGEGGVFGAYLSDAPRPAAHYFGTGECFLWRATMLQSPSIGSSVGGIPESLNLPPPPSADTTSAARTTTPPVPTSPTSSSDARLSTDMPRKGSGYCTPDRMRFKAFPYSGVNDYMIFCEAVFLSVGGGDGHYGLWLDDSLERGISSTCLTFGNEPLSDEGSKFDILGVELWRVG